MNSVLTALPFPVGELDDKLNIVHGNESFLELLEVPFESSERLCLFDYIVDGVEEKQKDTITLLTDLENLKINVFIRGKNGNTPVEITFFRMDYKLFIVVYDLSDQIQKNEKYVALREKMIKGMYQQGIAQSAIGVLHNIGNLLTIIKSNADNDQVLSELSIISSIFKKIDENFKTKFDKEKIGKLVETINRSYSSKIEKIEASFETIKETVLNMDDVIKTQQKYASVDHNQLEVFRVIDIIEDSLHLNTERISKRDIEVKIDIFPDLKGKFEKSGLIQICSNLLVNAIESMDARFDRDPNYTQKSIKISAKEESETIIILIEDNGAGFSNEVKSKLFDFGFSTKKRGSGFGLHECQSMLKFYGGSMSIDSQGVNLGATLKVIIPAN